MEKKIGFILVILLAGMFVAGDLRSGEVKNKDADDNSVYVCTCSNTCTCGKDISKKPGKCGCGNDLVPGQALKLEGKEALVCTCGKDCTCKLDEKDASKCGCGKPVRRVNVEGMYVCNCGNPKCFCTISDKPGECKCGKPLKKVS